MAATTENDGPKTPKALPTPKAKATPATPPQNDAAGPVLADPKVKPHDEGKGMEKARVEEKVKERVVIEQDLAVRPELQLKRRRYHVDSILVPEQHAPKEG